MSVELLSRILLQDLGFSERSSGIEVVTAASGNVLSLREAKLHCRQDIDDTREDEWFADAVKAVDEFAQRAYSFSLLTRTVRAYLDRFPSRDDFDIPGGPVSTLTSITYYDTANASTVWHQSGSEKVFLDPASQPDRVILLPDQIWPTASLRTLRGVAVEYDAGFGSDPSSVPGDVRHALKMLLGHFWENRAEIAVSPGLTVANIPLGAADILSMQRRLP